MKQVRFYFVIVTTLMLSNASAQLSYTSSNIFAHNDYVGSLPFHAAYQHRVGYIEADIFLENGELMVAHARNEITSARTLEALYLLPLANQIRVNGGSAYPGTEKTLTLMIDLKTAGNSTLPALVNKLDQYNDIISCKTLSITISGNVPPPDTWSKYPSYITFDGRPTVNYTDEQLKRVRLISDSFGNYSKWKGRGEMPAADSAKLAKVISDVHKMGKPIRFWAIPDDASTWTKLIDMQVDVLNTDHVGELMKFLDSR